MVYRIFVEKKVGLRHEADHLKEDIISFLQIKNLKDLRQPLKAYIKTKNLQALKLAGFLWE